MTINWTLHLAGSPNHSTVLKGFFLYIWPAQITQLSAGDCPFNYVECQILNHQLSKTYNWLSVANPADRNDCQWSSSYAGWSSTGVHFCQLDLLGTVDYTVFFSWWCHFFSFLVPWLWRKTSFQEGKNKSQTYMIIYASS